jgi:hypothetical protein
MIFGSCACGQLKYEIRSAIYGPINYCHCWRCRKQSGASFGTSASIRSADLVILTGADQMAFWESSPGMRRFFASCCGSPIYKANEDKPEELRIRLGTLDTDPDVEVEMHFMVGSKAPWVKIEDRLHQEHNGPPFGTKD